MVEQTTQVIVASHPALIIEPSDVKLNVSDEPVLVIVPGFPVPANVPNSGAVPDVPSNIRRRSQKPV